MYDRVVSGIRQRLLIRWNLIYFVLKGCYQLLVAGNEQKEHRKDTGKMRSQL